MLEMINSPEDIKGLSIDKLEILASEMRKKIIEVTSKNGGHVAPSLGTIELTLALHYVFDAPVDKIIWDVGHQAYGHKLITGRKDAFHTLRKFGGISGFLTPKESIYDVFGAGHASTSIAAAIGIATARDLNHEKYKVIAVIGDGAMTGGMALEGLNNLGQNKKDILIILNDNKMSIDENVGGLKDYLIRLQTTGLYNRLKNDVWDLLGILPKGLDIRVKETTHKISEGLKNLLVPTILFEEMGIRYFGPTDGHDLKELISILRKIEKIPGPNLLHIITEKGKGYKPAEDDPTLFHGLGPYKIETGEPIKKPAPPKYSYIYSKTLTEFAEKDPDIIAITAAMPEGTRLDYFKEHIPERFFDVGIAEQYGVTFAAGLAKRGKKPFATIYSTFLQRAYDQVIHDVCIQKLPVRFGIDRAGLVGDDGPTHHGTFDLSYLRIIPNMVVMAPKDERELQSMIATMVDYSSGPISVRYPRGSGVGVKLSEHPEPLKIGKAELLKEGKDIYLLAVGAMVYPSLEASKILEKKGISAGVINARFVKPLDKELICDTISSVKHIVTIEDNAIAGGFGSAILEMLNDNGIHKDLLRIGIPDRFVEHGTRNELYDLLDMSKIKIAERAFNLLSNAR